MTDSISSQVHNIVANTLGVPATQVTTELAIGDIPEWDSIANVRLLQAIEATFDIEIDALDALDAEDVFDFIKLVENYAR